VSIDKENCNKVERILTKWDLDAKIEPMAKP
jgi:hypothetical protein